jgi:hypothetical protein
LLLFSTHSKVNGYRIGWIAPGVLNIFWWELAKKRKSSVTLAHLFEQQEKMRENWKYVYFQCKFYFLSSSKFLF